MKKDLPKGWCEKLIKEVSEVSSGIGFPIEFQGKTFGSIPFYKVGDISHTVQRGQSILTHSNNYVNEEERLKLKGKLFPKGSIVFAKIGEALRLNRRAILSEYSLVDNNVMVVIPKENCNGLYLFHFLKTQDLSLYCAGNSVPSIRKGSVENLKILLPPLPEQERIVAKLDSLFAHLETAKQGLEKIPVLLKQFRQAVLTQAVTGKLTEEWREGKELPKTKQIPLAKVGQWKGGGTPSKSNPTFWVNGQIPWITAKDVKELFLEKSIDKITEFGVKNSSAILIPKNSILFVTRSGILRRTFPIAMNTVETTVNQDLKVLIPNEKYLPKYLLYILNGYEKKMRDECMKSGTTVESVEFSLLKEFCIATPIIEEQTEIVRRVEALFSKADAIEAQYKKLKEQIDQLPQAILAKAFRGEV
jgi:type I restriction enzyme S subunit